MWSARRISRCVRSCHGPEGRTGVATWLLDFLSGQEMFQGSYSAVNGGGVALRECSWLMHYCEALVGDAHVDLSRHELHGLFKLQQDAARLGSRWGDHDQQPQACWSLHLAQVLGDGDDKHCAETSVGV